MFDQHCPPPQFINNYNFIKIKKSDLYDLDVVLAKFILSRLVAYKKMKPISYPKECKTLKDWYEILDKMIFAMKKVVKEKNLEYNEKKEEGLKLFGEFFSSLWD